MASLPYLIISPTALLSFIGLLKGADKTVPTPPEDWNKVTVDLIIPAQNEENTIVLCLAAIALQTKKPRQVILIDDGSKDRTYEYAKEYCAMSGMEVNIIHRDRGQGKTPSINLLAHESDADVLFVLDADTILRSENYIERLVLELYQGVGIACACGVVLPLMTNDRDRLLKAASLKGFSEKYPSSIAPLHDSWFKKLQQKIANLYREELYLFLQKFIYRAEMIFFGSIINPIGCAVAYRRKYLKEVFDRYEDLLGNDLTTSEDIFIGFSFTDYGYRNVQIQDVYALTQEPPLYKLPPQIFKWSSAFFQSCYYFSELLATPFKSGAAVMKWYRETTNPEFKEIQKLRKIQEAYRQAFGFEYTQKYGRPIGWYIFAAALEKVTFPMVIVVMIYFQLWLALMITFGLEVLLYSFIIAIAHQNRKVLNFFKSIFLAPIRYLVLFYDIVVFLVFIRDVIFGKGRSWKK